jgi:hypothetical protein
VASVPSERITGPSLRDAGLSLSEPLQAAVMSNAANARTRIKASLNELVRVISEVIFEYVPNAGSWKANGRVVLDRLLNFLSG